MDEKKIYQIKRNMAKIITAEIKIVYVGRELITISYQKNC